MANDKNEPVENNARLKPDEMSETEIDENLMETFPASDPPSWTLGSDHERQTKSERDDEQHKTG